MAKDPKSPNLPAIVDEEDDKVKALSVLDASYDTEIIDKTTIDQSLIDGAIEYAKEHDEYTTFIPEVGKGIIVRFVGAKLITIPGQHDAILCKLHNYANGKSIRVWLGMHILAKIAANKLHESGKPFSLVYTGKVQSKKRKDKWAHGWNFYAFTDEERRKLFPPPVVKTEAKQS